MPKHSGHIGIFLSVGELTYRVHMVRNEQLPENNLHLKCIARLAVCVGIGCSVLTGCGGNDSASPSNVASTGLQVATQHSPVMISMPERNLANTGH
jgi:hypothetical protein